MRSVALLSALMLLLPAVALADHQVRYDLGSEDGFFDVRMVMEYPDAVPDAVVVGSLHGQTEFSDIFGRVPETREGFPVGPWSRGCGLEGHPGSVDASADGPTRLELGAMFFDPSCLQLKGSTLLFERITNFHDIQVVLPEGYGLLFCSREARADFQDRRVVLTIENPDREKTELKVVARLLWEDPSLTAE